VGAQPAVVCIYRRLHIVLMNLLLFVDTESSTAISSLSRDALGIWIPADAFTKVKPCNLNPVLAKPRIHPSAHKIRELLLTLDNKIEVTDSKSIIC
jgi:hypothetical protein